MSRPISQITALRLIALVYRRGLGLALVAAALAACQDASDPLAPEAGNDPSPPAAAAVGTLASDRIAYMAWTSNDSTDIWTMDPQGGTKAHLTTFSAWELEPAWSWDHQRIAFVRYRNGVLDISVMNADGSGKHWARSATYPYSIDMPSWSPDGTNLLVRTVWQNMFVLAKIDLATGNMSLIAPKTAFAVPGHNPVYHPNGKAIFYIDGTYKNIKRFVPGGDETTVFSSSVALSDLAVSPDGTRLAYTASVSLNNAEIWTLNLATKVKKQMTDKSGPDVTASWSPDGTKLAFASERSGKYQIYTMNSSTGGNVTKITGAQYGAASPAWAH